MDLSRVDLNLLVAFEALFVERSVTGAARRLDSSQPATSDALRRLRAVLDDELFVRAGGTMRPTPKAQQLAPGIQSALAQVRRTLGDTVPFDPAHAKRAFAIAATDYCTFVLMPALIADLRAHAPDIDLEVLAYDKSAVGDLLARGTVDVAIGVFAEPPENAVRTPVLEEEFVGVARVGHPVTAEAMLDPAVFARQPHALVTVNNDHTGMLDEALDKVGLRRRVVITLPHMLALPAILSRSDLVCALPRRLAATLDASLFQTFRLPLSLSSWTVDMLWNPMARTDQACAWLRNRILVAGGASSATFFGTGDSLSWSAEGEKLTAR